MAVVLPLYGAGVAWTLVYDTIYAHQDVADDARLGVRSTALHFGADTKRWLAGFSGVMVAGLVASGLAANAGPLFYAGVSAAGTHLTYQARALSPAPCAPRGLTRAGRIRKQITTVDLANRADCAAKFRSNVELGALVFIGAAADKLSMASLVA